jgi:hypothetical protein
MGGPISKFNPSSGIIDGAYRPVRASEFGLDAVLDSFLDFLCDGFFEGIVYLLDLL